MKGGNAVIQFIKQIQNGLFLIVFWVKQEKERLIAVVKNATKIPFSETIVHVSLLLSMFFLLAMPGNSL